MTSQEGLTTVAKTELQGAWLTRTLCVLFFFSGFPALIYQLTWQRALFLIFGVNIESVTIVVTAFMLGLGVGSLAGGWLSKRSGIQLLPLFAFIELSTAVFGFASLAIFDHVGKFTIGLGLPATAALSLLLVIVPTLLMGATLPLLVGHLVRRSRNLGNAVGILYYANTLGAGAACLACAVVLFPFLGMTGSIDVAVAMNLTVALGALTAQMFGAAGAEPIPRLDDAFVPAAGVAREFAPVLALAAFGGFVALSHEIFFFRIIGFATGSSPMAFALTLAFFLIGLALGSREAGEYCRTASRPEIMRRLVSCLLAACGLSLMFLPLLGFIARLDFRFVTLAATLMVLLFARFWGALLPYLAAMLSVPDREAGMRTAQLYLANIVGSAAGSVVTGFVLMNYLGAGAIAAVLVAASAACALMLIGQLAVPAGAKLRRAALAAAIALVAAIALPLDAGAVLDSLQWKGAADARKTAEIVENRNGIITVSDDGIVFGDGLYDGRFNTDLKFDTNGIVRPYALSLFHPLPRNVLMIGLSSGSWAQVIASNPDVASLTVVEINPGYLALIKDKPEVASLLANPKVSIVIDDGRRWLRSHPNERFDAVISNTTWHFRASVTNLLSVEFLQLVKRHLEPGGVLFYNTTESDRVQRTGCQVFAYGARFTNHMVVSEQPIDWDFQRWRRRLETYAIDGRPVFDLRRGEDRARIDELVAGRISLAPNGQSTAETPIEPCPDVLARTAGKQSVTDDNMGSEWRHFLGLEY